MTRPLVSILIDTYNHEQFIEQAIRSVLDQDFPAGQREIIVVDDGSTDRTPEIVRKFAPQVRLIRKSNGGQASAFNAGIPECQGEIIAFLDGDDWWAGNKLSRVAQAMAADPALGIVGHGILESFPDGTLRSVAPDKSERLRLNSLAAARVFRLRKSYLGTSRMTLRTSIARQILPVPESLLIEADEYLFTLAAALGDLLILQQPLTHYRLHGGNLYMAAGSAGGGLLRKQRSMEALAASLQKELPRIGVPSSAVTCVVEIIQAEADQMRLMLAGGSPWEAFRTENKIYEVMHTDASLSHRLFRALTTSPALFLPPRWFYAVRRAMGKLSWYRAARNKIVPVPEITRVAGPDEFKA
jgi:hypothetical protein